MRTRRLKTLGGRTSKKNIFFFKPSVTPSREPKVIRMDPLRRDFRHPPPFLPPPPPIRPALVRLLLLTLLVLTLLLILFLLTPLLLTLLLLLSDLSNRKEHTHTVLGTREGSATAWVETRIDARASAQNSFVICVNAHCAREEFIYRAMSHSLSFPTVNGSEPT